MRFNQKLGKMILDARTQKGLSLQDLAMVIGKSRELVNGWEKGRRDPSTEDLAKLVKYLDLDFGKLVKEVKVFDIREKIDERIQSGEFCKQQL